MSGIQPIVLFGGATGLIGDPSGKSAERTLLSEEVIAANVRSFRSQFERLDKNLREATGTNDLPETKYINNLDFYKDISAIGLLRDIGKHFRVT
jgi:tyrosyl-tRNA synthetase